MQCPGCGLFNPDGAVRCDCGWNFQGGFVEPPAASLGLYRSGRTLARAITVLLAVGILVATIGIYSSGVEVNLLNRVASGQVLTTETSDNDARKGLIALAQLIGFAATGVCFLCWVHRVYKNLKALGVRAKHPPGWAVGYFFIPVVNLVEPYRIVREIWTGSDPDHSPPGPAPNPIEVQCWWGLYLLHAFAGRAAGSMQRSPEASQVSAAWLSLSSDVLSILAAALAILLVNEIDDRQSRKFQQRKGS
jgi:hypothetical protein